MQPRSRRHAGPLLPLLLCAAVVSALVGIRLAIQTDSFLYPDGSATVKASHTESVRDSFHASKLDAVEYLQVEEIPTESPWTELIDVAALERRFQRNLDKTQQRSKPVDDEETMRANLDKMLQQLFPSNDSDDDGLNATDNSYNDDDFFNTTILVRDKPRDPRLSQLPSLNDTRSSVWTADERLVDHQSPLCNCTTHMDGRGPCCSRVFRRPHKMVTHAISRSDSCSRCTTHSDSLNFTRFVG